MGIEDSEDALAHEELLAELGWVRALAHRLVADPNVADDVLQRVCLVALEKRPRDVSGVAGIRRWLSTLTRRTAAHSQRAAGRRARREQRAARGEALPATVDVAERREVLHQLVDALSDLEAGDRLLLTQRYFDGLGIAEIAAQLELSESSLRQRLLRARRRLRERLERDAGPDRERWLAALGPVLLAPAAIGPAAGPLITASRAELARQSAQTVLSSPIGGAVMAKVASSLAVKVSVGVVLVAAAVVTSWQVMESGDGEVVLTPAPGVIRASTTEPRDLPEIAETPAAAPLTRELTAAVEEPPETSQESSIANLSGGLSAILEDATASFLTAEPDLQALNGALRQLAYAAQVVPDSVAIDPSDGSASGWLEIDGTDLLAEWRVDSDGRYRVELDVAAGDESLEPFMARDITLGFTGDAGHAADVSTGVQFHPDTSEEGLARLLPSLDGQEHHVGWHLEIGPLGTVGSPISLQQYKDQNAVIITASGGLPTLSQSWANDTSPYDIWLAKLNAAVP